MCWPNVWRPTCNSEMYIRQLHFTSLYLPSSSRRCRDIVLGEFRCERCGLNLVSVVLSVCGFSAVGFSPLPEISGISIVMYVSELFVVGNV